MQKFHIYNASAGSGKTYTLTREYIKLAMKNGGNFSAILAVTFTNKATEEMKERIIRALEEISKGNAANLTKELAQDLGEDEFFVKKQAENILSGILHKYSRFSISTIDSFFQNVIRAFAKETDLNANFQLELDTNMVLSEAINLMLADVGKDEYLSSWLVDFAEQKVESGKSWNMEKDLQTLGRELFSGKVGEEFEQLLTNETSYQERIQAFKSSRQQFVKSVENQMTDYGKQGIVRMQQFGLSIADFSYGEGGVAGYFKKIQKQNYEIKGRVSSAIEAEDMSKWYTSKSPNKSAIESAVSGIDGLYEILVNAALYHKENETKYLSYKEELKYVYALALLANISKKIQQYRYENDIFIISDSSKFLDKIIGNSDSPYIYEKVGNVFQHFLIDEFQDTSEMQWKNFKPLIENSLASDFDNLIVGDVKQSIYRWRGGDWKLLLNNVKQEIGKSRVKEHNLLHNWRSYKNVIDFNNYIFENAPIYAKNLLSANGTTDFEIGNITKAYQESFQQFPVSKLGVDEGFVSVEFFEGTKEIDEESEEENKTNWKEYAQKRLIEIVEKLQSDGYKAEDIAFLVRNRADATAIIDALQERKNTEPQPNIIYDAISAESLLLSNASCVRLLVSLLAYLQNTSDRIAMAHILHEYCRYINPISSDLLEQEINELFGGKGFRSSEKSLELLKKYLPAAFIEVRPSLNKMPIYELTETLVSVFKLNEITEERAYLQSFLDAILEYGRSGFGDISSFGEWWENKSNTLSVRLPKGQNAMQIVTIHKSKGLEYPIVIIPFCDWNLDHQTNQNNFMWLNNENSTHEMESIPLKYSHSLVNTFYIDDYYKEKTKTFLDNINLLYVAFTRAEKMLFCLSEWNLLKENGTEKKQNFISSVLKKLLQNTPVGQWNEEEKKYTLGELKYSLSKHSEKVQEIFEMGKFRAENWRDNLTIRSNSQGFFEISEEKKERREKIKFGVLLHDVMASIHAASDLDSALNKAYFKGQISTTEKTEIERCVRLALENTQVNTWFSKDWTVFNETEFISPTQPIRRPDRIIIQGKQAIIIDFKTGQKSHQHPAQVKNYMAFLEKLNYQIQGYLLYLPSSPNDSRVEVEEVVM